MDYVYHGSKKSGITELKPNKSTHGISYVYATSSKELAMILSMKIGDLLCLVGGTGKEDNPIIFVERKPGIFQDRLHKDTNIYTLDGKDFEAKTQWAGEVVTDKPQKVIKEEYIQDVYTELEKSEQEGTLKMYRYPERPEGMPLDNSDLIEHWLDAEGVSKCIKLGELILVSEEYPELTQKISYRIQEEFSKNDIINNTIKLYRRIWDEKRLLNSATKIFPQFEKKFKSRVVFDKIIHADRYLSKYIKIGNYKMKQYFDNQIKKITTSKSTRLLPEGRDIEKNTEETMSKTTFRDSIKVDVHPTIELESTLSSENIKKQKEEDRFL